MTKNNLLSEKLNYTGASHTPTHLHFCTYNTEILEYHQGASIKEFSPFIRPDAINWVQIHGLQNTEIVQEVCDFFHIDFLTTQDILNAEHLTKIEEHDTYNVVILKQLSVDEENTYTPQQLCIVQGNNFVLTFMEHDSDFFNEIHTALKNNTLKIRNRQSDFLLSVMLNSVMASFMSIISRMEDQLEDMEESLLSPETRSGLTLEDIQPYRKDARLIKKCILPLKEQMSKFIDFSEGKALMVNNADWLLDLNYVEVLREIGPHFSVNRMLTAECYKQRMEKGLSFLEFNYMIMQAYDFYALFQKYGCNMQFGGDDQWSNMLAGTELIRRKLGEDAGAMTITLLLNSEGKKMGKTQSGAVWLDPNKTSPFDFYQYWRNVADADVLKCIRMLTFLPLEEIDKMDSWEGAQLNTAKEILAYELTKLVHGEEEAKKAQESARALFSKGNAAEMPTAQLTEEDLTDGKIDILTMLVKSGLVTSKSEARRAVQQGGVAVDGEKVSDIAASFGKEELSGEGIILKKGKKNFRRVVAE